MGLDWDESGTRVGWDTRVRVGGETLEWAYLAAQTSHGVSEKFLGLVVVHVVVGVVLVKHDIRTRPVQRAHRKAVLLLFEHMNHINQT